MAAAKVEFGDFQTPPSLARRVCRLLQAEGMTARTVIEPTCGIGNFLAAAVETFPEAIACGYEIDDRYAKIAAAAVTDFGERVRVRAANFFKVDWSAEFSQLAEPFLVVGNPPWVTNAAVGAINGANLPKKANSQQLRGIDAITGKSNFDVSEWMLVALIDALKGREATVAMLVKEAVARKVLYRIWNRGDAISEARIYLIDAAQEFGASVAACLFMCRFGKTECSTCCDVYDELSADEPARTIGYRAGRIVADIDLFGRWKHLGGTDHFRWRSGIKHDCASVVELVGIGGQLTNRLGETVEIEEAFLFPLLKGSDVVNDRTHATSRRLLVTQRAPSDDTSAIERHAPLTWNYLCRHRELFERRKSSIYRKRSDFAMFGVGEYSFAPYKIAIAGLSKQLAFRKVPPLDGPVVFDDTVCFLPAFSERQADVLLTLLSSEPCQEFLSSLIFWDSKRPITIDVLDSLNLNALADELGQGGELRDAFRTAFEERKASKDSQKVMFG